MVKLTRISNNNDSMNITIADLNLLDTHAADNQALDVSFKNATVIYDGLSCTNLYLCRLRVDGCFECLQKTYKLVVGIFYRLYGQMVGVFADHMDVCSVCLQATRTDVQCVCGRRRLMLGVFADDAD